MAELYYLGFTDVEGVLHVCNIADDTPYIPVPALEIFGSCTLQSGSIDNVLTPIRGIGLTLSLEADVNSFTFNDLYTDDDFTYTVTYIRDGVTLFEGYINPEGLYQDFVNDKWIIQLECVDGLSYLDNLSYVDDTTGLPFLGKQKEIEVIANCLKRTKILKNINVSVNLFYTGLSTALCVLDNVYVNTERFIKDDGDTYMNCAEVLQSTLDKYSAVLVQRNNEWYIVRIPDLVQSSELDFFKFTSSGVYSSMNNNVELGIDLGSQIDDYYPHWVNANQNIAIKSAIAAYRINYKYGFVKSFISNIFLENDGVSTIADYTINDGTYLAFPASNIGILLSCADNGATKTLTSDAISLAVGDKIKFESRFITNGDATTFKFIVKLDNGGGIIYYMDSNGEWFVASTTILQLNAQDAVVVFPDPTYLEGTGASVTYEILAQPLPDSGDLSVEIYSAQYSNALGFTIGNVNLTKFEITPIIENNAEGENFTFQRDNKPSAKIQNTKEVFTGDSSGDIYVGTIYESDATTATQTWFRGGVTEGLPILYFMGYDTLNINQNNAKIFNGDVFGYVPYLSIITINNVSGTFLVLEYFYDALNNITSLKLVQVYYTALTGVSYNVTFDYGNVVEPTIIG